MRLFFITILFCLIYSTSNAELLKPKPNIKPIEVISIQLSALQNNNIPYDNAGIAQTWEFAHPFNREYTGPLDNFTSMMYSPSYIIMLNHQNHNIITVSEENDQAFFFIELTDKLGNEFGFQWTLKKVSIDGDYKNCWMTTGVSRPMPLAKST
tara:strand:+ start:599 stop:1057 length:459 start_codon:yes stop_codon:yes gene_type:complete